MDLAKPRHVELSSVRRCLEVLACAAVAAGWLGCGELEDTASTSSEVTACTTVSAGSPWWSAAFPPQTGRFHVELTATPSAGDVDAVIGLSRGAASHWAHLAATVRFNPAGFVDARAGNVYRADVAYPYFPGTTYFVRFDVDLGARTYSVWLKTSAGDFYQPVARDYPFRTEQAAAAVLDHAAAYLEPSHPGSLALCELAVVQDDTTANGCTVATAGGGFANAQLAGTSGAMIVPLLARPSAANLDAVVGFANGAVDAFSDLAASIRFYTNGMIEARDGDTYRADQAIPYTAGAWYELHAFLDVPSKTYSVIVTQSGTGEYLELARGYRFRTQQQLAPALDRGAAVVASATGRLDACGLRNTAPPTLRFMRPGTYGTLPLPGGQALISDDTRTWKLDAAGKTLAELPLGGTSAVDASGNLYLAHAAGGTLAVRSFTSALAPRWSRTYAVTGSVAAAGVYATGALAVAVGDWSQPQQLVQISASGTEQLRRDLTPSRAIAIGPSGYVLAIPSSGGTAVEARRPDGSLRWQRTWTGSFTVDHLAIDPAAGVVFTGTFWAPTDFGDGQLEPASNPDSPLNTFLVSLSPTGALRFSKHVYSTNPTGVASNGTRIALASTGWTQMPNMELRAFDATGALVWGHGAGYPPEGLGYTGAVAIGSTGRIYANLSPKLYPGALAPPWPFLFGFDP